MAKRLRSVKLQAGKARNYLEYTQKLKELQVNYSLVEYGRNKEQLDSRSEALHQAEEFFSAAAAEEAGAEAAVSRLGNEIIDREHKLSETGNALVSIQSKIDQKIQRIDFLRSRITELEQRRRRRYRRSSGCAGRATPSRRTWAAIATSLTACDRTVAEKTEAIEEIQKITREADAQLASLEAELEDEKSGIIDIVRRTAQLHNEIQSISNYRTSLSNQRDRLASRAELAKAELERVLTEKAQYNARLGDIARVLEELEQNLESKRQEIEKAEAEIAENGKHLAHSKEARSALSSELAVLTDMERRYEGLGNAVKSIVKAQNDESRRLDYVDGILAEKIVTDVAYAGAVEAALEGLTDVLLVRDVTRLLQDGQTLSNLEGRVQFRGLDCPEPFVDDADFSAHPFVKGRLVEFVRFKSKYAPLAWSLLGKTLVVDSLDAAMQLSDYTRAGYTFVTLSGECLSREGLIRLGPLGKATRPDLPPKPHEPVGGDDRRHQCRDRATRRPHPAKHPDEGPPGKAVQGPAHRDLRGQYGEDAGDVQAGRSTSRTSSG